MNDIARWKGITPQERMQFAQLIGYSVNGFSELSYVDDETYDAVENMIAGDDENTARLEALREQMDGVKKGLKMAVTSVFRIHPDDLVE